LKIMSADTERLTAAVGRSVRAIAAWLRRAAKPHPELYELPARRVDAEGVVKARLSEPDVSTEQARAMQAYLPIGPSCC
jgi:hypothetical protein